MSPFIGTDEICDLTDEQKVVLSSFILVNEPYNLKVRLTEYENLECFQDEDTLINMYRCPFAIEDENGEINPEISYLISQGEDETKAIVYRQDNLQTDLSVDAEVDALMDVRELGNMIKAGLLSKEGRKFLTYYADSNEKVEAVWQQYLEFLHPEKGKLKYT